MTAGEINEIRRAVLEERPLIHAITNPISINQCANAILAVGASPIMAEHPSEVAEICVRSKALVLNLGNITDVRMESMQIAAEAAVQYGIPCVTDAVGVACSTLRRKFLLGLLEKYPTAIIKGNYSEIYALYDSAYCAEGVDAKSDTGAESAAEAAKGLAHRYGAVVLASGAEDIVCDGTEQIRVKNGTSRLATVTGTGCMLGMLCGVYLSVCRNFRAAVTACAVLGICGELADVAAGSGSFMAGLLDRLSDLSDDNVERRLRIEEI